MRNFISEDQIEKAIIRVFEEKLSFRHLDCYTSDPGDLNDGSERKNKAQVYFPEIVRRKLREFNAGLPEETLQFAYEEVTRGRQSMSTILANKEIYTHLRDGIRVEYEDKRGRAQKDRAHLIDFQQPEKNDFLVVSQLWIKGEYKYRRPDLIVYVNGLPLVFIELKNSNVKLKTAYDDNLTNYRAEIPQLFHYNAITILSNGLETRVGSFNADWEHFGLWLRVADEKEQVDKKRVREYKVSLDYAVLGLCEPGRLIDYFENFVLYHNDAVKIIAKNHQFLGVNNAIAAFEEREKRAGKLGVFWHTQGSGKSFSMIFFARKIFRKYPGNYTFLIVTDRDDLDRQIYKNFLSTDALKKSQASRPKNSAELRDFLKTNKRFIFSLIHKFRYPKGKKYPLLSERDDIIAIVDEAHRTQYAGLAENMRTGLPNAQYIAFTGTPLLGKDRKTNAWFGEYVSEYNFAQAIADGATVPLFYEKRVPEVEMYNENLNEDLAEILEDDNLSDAQKERLEREFAQEMEVIKRDDRLEIIAKDIVYHFPRRGYKGKGMVISVDKFTAVKMYDKAQRYWREEMRGMQKQIARSKDPREKEELKSTLKWMQKAEMAVIVSEENGEEEKFAEQNLDIKPHRKRMNALDENGRDAEYNFKDPNHPLQLTFVCAMWLTGFDAPTVSTLYLDKPMKNHTLMQAIARANRVAPGKVNGEIIDYYNVFRNIKRALADYGQGENADPSQNSEGADPVEKKAQLFVLLQSAIDECLQFCRRLDIDLESIAASDELFDRLEKFNDYADKILQNDETRSEFTVYDNTITSLYEACKPDILKRKQEFKLAEVVRYLRGVIDGLNQPGDISQTKRRISDLLDISIVAREDARQRAQEPESPQYMIRAGRELDLSKIDFGKLREEFKNAEYKNIEVTDLRAFLEDKLARMLARNVNRIDFAQRLQEIIDRYNAGGRLTEDYFDDLLKFAKALREEEKRHIRENLSEEELELFDLLQKEKLTKKEKQAVKNAAQRLLRRLKAEQPRVLIQDWHKDTQSRLRVKNVIEDILDKTLPESYDRKVYTQKCTAVYTHFLSKAGRAA